MSDRNKPITWISEDGKTYTIVGEQLFVDGEPSALSKLTASLNRAAELVSELADELGIDQRG